MFKFKLAVLLKFKKLWLDTLVFLSMRLVVIPNQIQYTEKIDETRVNILRIHYAPKLSTLNVLQIAY